MRYPMIPQKRKLFYFPGHVGKNSISNYWINEKISFNKEATRWLGIWVDSQLKFSSHIYERIKRARIAEIQMKELTQMYGLVPALVRRIQFSVVQSTA